MDTQALRLLVDDLRELLQDVPGATPALRRLTLFEMIYVQGKVMSKVALLKTEGGTMVCDEYWPDDYGRVHVMGRPDDPHSFFAHYHKDDKTFDYKKCSFDVTDEVFVGDAWPIGVIDTLSPASICAYFGVPYV